MQKVELKKDFWFWLHLLIILSVYVCPFVFDYRIVFGLIVLYYLQNFIFGGCIITLKQFHTKDGNQSFYIWLLNRYLGFNFDPLKSQFVLRHVIPWMIFLISIIWQVFLSQKVWITLPF